MEHTWLLHNLIVALGLLEECSAFPLHLGAGKSFLLNYVYFVLQDFKEVVFVLTTVYYARTLAYTDLQPCLNVDSILIIR